jgi:hypothetical protein
MTFAYVDTAASLLIPAVLAGVLTVPFLLCDRISRWLRRR